MILLSARSDVFPGPLHARGHRQPGAWGRRALAVDGTARHWLCPGVLPGVYEPRSQAGTVLHQIVGTHLERFLAETAAATGGAGVPRLGIVVKSGAAHVPRGTGKSP